MPLQIFEICAVRAFYGTDNSLCTCGNGDACRSLARMSTWVELISRSALSQSQHLVQRTHIYDIVCAFIIIGSQHHNVMLHTTTCTEITTGSFLEHELALPDFLSLSLHTDAGLPHLTHAHTHECTHTHTHINAHTHTRGGGTKILYRTY